VGHPVHNCDAANDFFVISKVGILTVRRHIPDDCSLNNGSL